MRDLIKIKEKESMVMETQRQDTMMYVSEFLDCNRRFPKAKELAEELGYTVDRADALLKWVKKNKLRDVGESQLYKVVEKHIDAITSVENEKVNAKLIDSFYDRFGLGKISEEKGNDGKGSKVAVSINIIGLEPKNYEVQQDFEEAKVVDED